MSQFLLDSFADCFVDVRTIQGTFKGFLNSELIPDVTNLKDEEINKLSVTFYEIEDLALFRESEHNEGFKQTVVKLEHLTGLNKLKL